MEVKGLRANYVNIGRRKQMRRSAAGRILVVTASAVIIFILSILLGNYLRAKADALPARGDIPEQLLSGELPADTSDASRVSIMASHLPLAPLTDDSAIAAVVEELTLGSREAVSLCLRDTDGNVHFRSSVAKALTGQEAAGGLDLPVLIPALRNAGIYSSAVFAVTSFAETDAVARELLRAFEISLAGEIGGAGVDEILLTGLPLTVDTLDTAIAFVDEIRAQLPDGVHLAVAVPHDIVASPAGSVLVKQLSRSADTVAIDLRTLSQDGNTPLAAAASALFSDASLYFSKYNMRVILPQTDDTTFTELRQILELNAIHNWQIIG